MSDGLIFKCPGCDAEFEADLTMIGTESECPECGIHFIVPTPTPEEGMVIAGFRLKKRLGEGGMGEVWLAEQVAMTRQVAIKILSPSLVSKPDFVKRFLHEVRIAGRLEHPNIITAFDAGQVQGFFYLAMAYCDGVELSDRLRIDNRIPEKESLKIARDIALALDYAWTEHRILHRDIKPSNIMIARNGEARLMDMGISKSFKDTADVTMSGTIVGTPYYISPEQGRADDNVDFRSDIYSLGATLYHMTTGQFPFDGDTTMGIVAKHIHQPLIPPRKVNPSLSPYLCALIEKMMAKNPDKRQVSWKNVLADIDLVMNAKLPDSKPIKDLGTADDIHFDRTITFDHAASVAAAAAAAAADIKIKINTAPRQASENAPIVITPTPTAPAQTPPPVQTTPQIPVEPRSPTKSKVTHPRKIATPSPWPTIFSIGLVMLLIFAAIRIAVCFGRVGDSRTISIDATQMIAAEDLLAQLRKDAVAMIAKKRPDDAISLVLDYNGDLAAETAGKRQQLAEQLRQTNAETTPATKK